MARPRAGAPLRPAHGLPLLAALACTANQPDPAASAAEPTADPDKPTKAPRKPAAVQPANTTLHMVARRYGPLRLQRLATDQLAIRGDLALALLASDGNFHRAEHDLDNQGLAATAALGDIVHLGGRWPDRSFLVGQRDDPTHTPSVWRRVFNARWERVANDGFDGATPLRWQYELSAPWPGGETVAVRVLTTVATPTAPSAPVRAFVELVSLARGSVPSASADDDPVPQVRDADAPSAVPNPDESPVPADSPDPPPTAAPVPEASRPPTAAPVPGTSPPPTDEPVPEASPAPGKRTATSAPPVVFPRLPRTLFPRDLAAAAGNVWVLAPDGSILETSPRARQPGRWHTLPESHLPLPRPTDRVRLHAADSGQLYVVACIADVPLLKRWDGAAWHDEAVPSSSACPTSVAEAADGALWLTTTPADGHTLWQRPRAGTWTGVDLPRIHWTELAWDRWFAETPKDLGHTVWERDSPPAGAATMVPALRASDVHAFAGAVWVVTYAANGRALVPHVVLSTHQPLAALEFPAGGEESLDAEDRGDIPFDRTCSDPFLLLRDLAADEHGADILPVVQSALARRPEFADTVLVEVVRRDGRRQLGAIWTHADAMDEGFGPLGELGEAVDKLRPEVSPTMLCLLPRVRFGVELGPR